MAHLFIVAELHIKKAPLREQWSLEDSFAVLLDGLVPWQDSRLDTLKPCEISLELLFFKLETLFFSFFFCEPCKPLVDGEELVDPLNGFFADANEEIFFLQVWRDGLDEVPPCMCPAEGMCLTRRRLVAGVAVCLQDAIIGTCHPRGACRAEGSPSHPRAGP